MVITDAGHLMAMEQPGQFCQALKTFCHDAMTSLFIKSLPDNKANLYGLILEASKIPYEFRRVEDGWQILVPARDHDAAFAQITAYTGEKSFQGP